MIKGISLFLMIISGLVFTSGTQFTSIQGSWVSEDDPSWRIVFDDSTCKWFYGAELQDNYSYQINNSSPQCNKEVLVNSKTLYLSITNTSDSSDKICYEIYGLSNDTLTLRAIDKGGFLIFHR